MSFNQKEIGRRVNELRTSHQLIKEDYTSFFDTAGYIPFTGNGVLKVNLCVIQHHENDAEEEIHTNDATGQVSGTVSTPMPESSSGLSAIVR